MKKIKTRNEVDSNDKWRIDLVYKDVDEFHQDLERVKVEIRKLIGMKDTFLNSSSHLLDFLRQDEIVMRLLDKLSIYAHCKNDEDQSVSTYQELKGIVTNLYSEYNEKTSFVVPSILKINQEIIDRYLEEEKELESYRYFFNTIFDKKKHILPETVEQTLSAYQPIFNSSGLISSYLMNADLKFGNIEDENGEKVEFSEANYANFIRSNNRRVRKDAFYRLYKVYNGVENTLSATYNTIVNYDAITSRVRGYDSSIDMYLSSKRIPIKLYDNLIQVVRDNLKILYDYYDLKKEILQLDEFHLYDSYVEIVGENEKNYSFNEAEKLVVDALSVYGKDYQKILKSAFSNGWIDKFPNKGKKSGAYSSGGFDTLPYILLNYTDTYNDVSTLAHELGHSMHTYYTVKNNPYITADYPIFLAEIASTTNELLLSHYMYKNSNNKKEKLSILNEKLDLFKATIFRQTMFAEFEKKAHEYVDSGNVLTSDYLCNMYYQLNKDYFGDHVVVDDEIKYEWLRIPHFYTPFYVYQYATSLSISCYVAQNIINNTPGFKEKYIEFLKSGGKDYPLEVLKIIDIDLTDTKVFESAIDEFKKTLEEFKNIYYEK